MILNGHTIISSPNMYRTEVKVLGIADKNKPNGKKPFYRNVTKFIPTMARIGTTIYCHPLLLVKIREEFQK